MSSSGAMVLCGVMLILSLPPSSQQFSDLIEILSFGGELASSILDTWSDVASDINREEGYESEREYLGPQIPGHKRNERKLLSRISDVIRLVGQVEHRVMANTEASVQAIIRDLPDALKLELKLDHLAEYLTGVAEQDQILAEYIKAGYDNSSELESNAQQSAWHLERHTLLDFAMNAVSHAPNSVRGFMNRINSLIAPQSEHSPKSIFLLLKNNLQGHESTLQCSSKQSLQQLLLNLYGSIQLVQLKGFGVMQFSWMLLRLYEKGNFSLEGKIYAQQFKKSQISQASLVRKVMREASRETWRCDPDQHVEGKTYEQVTRLLQGFLVNEVDLNKDESCKENCGYFNYAETYGCYSEQYCAKQPRCHGRLFNCQYFDSDMWVCPDSAGNSSSRRYAWIEYENGKVLGRRSKCPSGETKVDSWWRFLYHCSYCICMCDQEGPGSDRYFSLRPVLSDIANNKVVTGVRIVKHNRIFYIQIEEGKVRANGTIDSSDLDWKPINSFPLYGRQVLEGQDYFKLDWEQRAVDLDDLVSQPGYVLTGLAFRDLGGHLNLIIRSTPFDWKTGTLRQDASIWVDNDNTASSPSPRKELRLEKPDVPTESHAPAIPDSKPDMFVKFSNSDLEADAAQTTVPFVDIQPVVPNPAVLLSGAGLYHKGQPYFGGFIALKVFTYDYSDLIKPISFDNDLKILSVS